MKLEILGTGCTKCKRMYDNVTEAVKKSGIQAEVIKIEALEDIVSRGVMMTPSLFLDGEEVIAGRVPTVNEIIEIIKESA
ncbi:MAG TPA: thioredoxin family protein [Methanospirillum sp.]|uniref:thioredoxin family protein n=1 Tax=Methanospirillum sp. TaxID=45200 RepID=UPI002CA5F7BD|nr:thioredoxin family protein [Methanospirillum sp.]HOJ95374.1 thioredoxin family protein [Methanospirillum sp.]HOL41572.1 thioredoxin family protein [Methanospirillum sp.]HPP76855.1 thioredoxin family protein [Methanospirillum sp.]